MRQRDDLDPTAWNCHLHPSLRFSGSSNHLIHAFLAVVSLGNLCPPKLLHLGTQHSVPRLFLLRLSMPPTATHQQDNSYGGSAIWRVSKFVIPLIVGLVSCNTSCPTYTGHTPSRGLLFEQGSRQINNDRMPHPELSTITDLPYLLKKKCYVLWIGYPYSLYMYMHILCNRTPLDLIVPR